MYLPAWRTFPLKYVTGITNFTQSKPSFCIHPFYSFSRLLHCIIPSVQVKNLASSLTSLSLTHHTFYHQILRAIPSKYIPTPNIFTTSVAMTLFQATFTSYLDYQIVSSSSLYLYQFSTQQLQSFCKNIFLGFPWWPSGLESTFQCRGSSSVPLSFHTLRGSSGATKPRTATREAHVLQLLHLEPTLYNRSPCSATQTQHTPKNKGISDHMTLHNPPVVSHFAQRKNQSPKNILQCPTRHLGFSSLSDLTSFHSSLQWCHCNHFDLSVLPEFQALPIAFALAVPLVCNVLLPYGSFLLYLPISAQMLLYQ